MEGHFLIQGLCLILFSLFISFPEIKGEVRRGFIISGSSESEEPSNSTIILQRHKRFLERRGGSSPKFYYSGGSYFLADNRNIQGCVGVDHTSNGGKKSPLRTDGQCVKVYARNDCQGPALQAPAGYPPSFVYDEVSSFHSCSWNPPQHPEVVQSTMPPTYSLYAGEGHSSFLLNLTEIRECTNLPTSANNRLSSIIPRGHCIRLYDGVNCQGEMLEVTGTSLYHWDLGRFNFNNKASSVNGCGSVGQTLELPISQQDNPNGPLYSLTVATDHGSLVVEYSDLNDCKNIPDFADERVSSVKTNGNCLRIYEDKNCQGAMQELSTSRSQWDLRELDFVNKTSSIDICGRSKLQAKVTKFNLRYDLKSLLLGGEVRRVELASPLNIVNNGTEPMEQTFQGQGTYRESFNFERIVSFQDMDSVGVDQELRTDCNGNVPFISDLNLTAALQTAYGFQSGGVSPEQIQPAKVTLRSFEVNETLTLPGCTVNDIRSFILVKEEIPLEFEMEVVVSGEIFDGSNLGRGAPLRAGRVRSRLPEGMEYVRDLNGLELVAKTQGRILVSVAIKSEVETESSPLPECNQVYQ